MVPDKELLKELVSNKIYVFGTNLRYINKFIEPIPIGIENAYYGRNGDLNYYNPINLASIKIKKENLLLASFNTWTNPKVRIKYESILKSYKYKNKNFNNLKDYRKVLSSSYFVISPPGNGIDCHRTWEAFIHKTIPVIEKKYYLFQHKLYNKIMKKNYETIYAQWWFKNIISK